MPVLQFANKDMQPENERNTFSFIIHHKYIKGERKKLLYAVWKRIVIFALSIHINDVIYIFM